MAPTGIEETTGELVQEIPEEDEITEVQLPGTATGPLTASANRMKISTSGWGIQLLVGQRATSACYSNAISTSAAASQDQSHSTAGSPTDRMCL